MNKNIFALFTLMIISVLCVGAIAAADADSTSVVEIPQSHAVLINTHVDVVSTEKVDTVGAVDQVDSQNADDVSSTADADDSAPCNASEESGTDDKPSAVENPVPYSKPNNNPVIVGRVDIMPGMEEFLDEIEAGLDKQLSVYFCQFGIAGSDVLKFKLNTGIDREFLRQHYRELLDMDKLYTDIYQSHIHHDSLAYDSTSYKEFVFEHTYKYFFEDNLKAFEEKGEGGGAAVYSRLLTQFDLNVIMMSAVASRHDYESADKCTIESTMKYLKEIYVFKECKDCDGRTYYTGGTNTYWGNRFHTAIGKQLVHHTPVADFSHIYDLYGHVFGASKGDILEDFFFWYTY